MFLENTQVSAYILYLLTWVLFFIERGVYFA